MVTYTNGSVLVLMTSAMPLDGKAIAVPEMVTVLPVIRVWPPIMKLEDPSTAYTEPLNVRTRAKVIPIVISRSVLVAMTTRPLPGAGGI